jgi:hypothetical protein
MPWRGPELPNEYPTLGYQVADWIEARCAIPDREFVGDPFLLTDDQLAFLLAFYRLDPDSGVFVHYRGGQLTRPQKWGKGPLTAAVICAEAQGPVRFGGWDADGEPVGIPVPTPLIQVTAVSEAQTQNVYSALLPMIQLGALHGEIEDTGLGRINLSGGGKIEPVTASGRSRLGQRLTFATQDQTESWLASNGGRDLADNQRRNLAGMGGRWLSTPNAWDPAEDSVAQYTSEHEHEGVLHDDVEPPESLSIRNKAELRRMLRHVYGDAVTGRRDGRANGVTPWIDLDRIEAEIKALVERDPAQAERWFCNRKRAAESAAFSVGRWADSATPAYEPPRGALVVLGIDGAIFDDALAIVATEVSTGFQWLVGLWERPADAGPGYEHPFDEIDGALADVIDGGRYDVWRAYVDPQWIKDWVDVWQGRWGAERISVWRTNRPRPIAWAVRNYADAIAAGRVAHDGNEDFARHVGNARKQKLTVRDDKGTLMHTIAKDRSDSPHKMDAAMAGVLSRECQGDAIAAGATSGGASREAIFI